MDIYFYQKHDLRKELAKIAQQSSTLIIEMNIIKDNLESIFKKLTK